MDTAFFLGWLWFVFAWIVGRLPLFLQRAWGDMAGRVAYRCNTRAAKVARRNMEIIAPHAPLAEREIQVRQILRASGRNVMEMLRVWTRSRAANLKLVRHVHGLEQLEVASAGGKGVIIAAPHYGNWELLVEYLAARGPFTLVYRVPKKKAGDIFLRLARSGPNVQLVPAENNAMRPLWKALQAGQWVGITPDQQPKSGGGEFASFFGKQTLTLSLIPRLAERTGAAVVFAYAEPCAGGFDIHFEAAAPDIASADLAKAMAAMNAQVETIARRDFRQYQWTYKRYALRPTDSGEVSPY